MQITGEHDHAMTDEMNIAELRRRVSLIEQDVEGERGVSRHRALAPIGVSIGWSDIRTARLSPSF
jgi:hypothetical protein